jgi:hypothetical protein
MSDVSQSSASANLKAQLAREVYALIEDIDLDGAERVEVTHISALQFQVKAYPRDTGAPRYFLVSIKELI